MTAYTKIAALLFACVGMASCDCADGIREGDIVHHKLAPDKPLIVYSVPVCGKVWARRPDGGADLFSPFEFIEAQKPSKSP